jgi:RNA-directed DNA polymerase
MGKERVSRLRLWQRHVTKHALLEAWGRIEESGGAGRDGITSRHFAGELQQSIARLNRNLRRNDHNFIAYLQLLKSKGEGKPPRVISIPTTIDRLALRAMATYLRAVHPEQASTKLPQDLISEVITELEAGRWSYFIKLDVVNFYPSIRHDFLRAVLTKHIRHKSVIETYMAAVSTPTAARGAKKPTNRVDVGVPQGLAISNALAELTMEHVDRYLKSSSDFIAFRFVDDILVLTHQPAVGQITAEVRRLSKLAGLLIHEEDSGKGKHAKGPLDAGFDFLGYQFEWPRITVRKGSVAKLESRITRAFTAYKYALARNPTSDEYAQMTKERLKWHLDLVITGFTLDKRRIGWLAYFSQIRNQHLLQHLDAIVRQKADRFGVQDLDFKRFILAYRAVASRRANAYVPNFDSISHEEMIRVMADIFGMTGLERLTEEEIRARFLRKIKRISRDLEADVPSYT